MARQNDIVGVVVGRAPNRLLRAMQEEFERNGRRTLSAGKIRHLRRAIRRGR